MSDLSLRRRSLLLGGVGGAVGLAMLGHGTAAAAADPPQPPIFDFDTGNGIDISFQPDARAGQQPSAGAYAPMDLTSAWVNHVSAIAWFDTVAPYHPTAVGVYTRVARRPASESATNRNMNIGIFHSSYQMIKALVPEVLPELARLMVAVGLNPNDESEDPTTPVGIGNLAGKGVIAARARDGMNLLGDDGRRYNPRPFADYTGYQPVNTAYELTNPSRWQPQLTPHRRRLGAGTADKGVFTVQHFATPQMRLIKPYTFQDPAQFRLAPPDFTDHHRRGEYKRSVDEVLAASAALTDAQKVMAELFDNTQLGIGHAAVATARRHKELGLHGWAQLFLAHSTAIIDAVIAIWHQKARYDAVRPASAIRHVYGHRPVTAWGGPGKGTVHDMPADEWASYLNTGTTPSTRRAGRRSAPRGRRRRGASSTTTPWTGRLPLRPAGRRWRRGSLQPARSFCTGQPGPTLSMTVPSVGCGAGCISGRRSSGPSGSVSSSATGPMSSCSGTSTVTLRTDLHQASSFTTKGRTP
ncbi:hypothetical protein Prum_009680 [Phytohabitans rumicis]|uniref:Uncharacterized protein n=1 Tax=Phytohabitans rumicis TaxID=1076125 RepID=A0A6V8KZT2_9ACTN|nr:hypothetical protein Prum_009680 [Phytohabitans rumicis]